MRECSSLYILPTKSNIKSFSKKRTKSQTLGSSKINSVSIFYWFSSRLINLLYGRVDTEVLRNVGDFLTYQLQLFMTHSSSTQSAQIGKINNTVVSSTSPFGDIKSWLETFSVSLVDVGIVFVPNFLYVLLAYHTFFYQFFSIDVVNRRPFAYSLIHHWLSKSKLLKKYAGWSC